MGQQPRWERRKQARAPEILDAALACFSEKGFAATRMEDIARRAGISKGTIYLYFDSKQAVFKALAQRVVGSRVAEIGALVQSFQGPTPELVRLVLARVGQIVSTGDVAVLPRMVIA